MRHSLHKKSGSRTFTTQIGLGDFKSLAAETPERGMGCVWIKSTHGV